MTKISENDEERRSQKRKRRSRRRARGFMTAFLVVLLLGVIAILSVLLIIEKRDAQKVELQAAMLSEEIEKAGNENDADLINEASYNKGYDDCKNKLKEYCESGESIVDMLRSWYPEYVVYNTKTGYVFAPIQPDVPKAEYPRDSFVTEENGDIAYYSNGNKISKKGIDVSKYQGEIDWEKVAASDIEYAMLRVGIRGYGTGKLVIDETFEDNIEGASKYGIPIGVYFATQAVSTEEAIEEAELVIEALKDSKLSYPVAIDVEDVNDSEARTANLTAEQRTDYTIAFLERIKEAGYDTMIYGNLKSFCGMLQVERLTDYEFWFAYYDKYIYFPYRISMWQYTEKGRIDGIEGDVDINLLIKEE